MIDGIAGSASIQDNLISTYYEKDDYSGKVFLKEKPIRETSKDLIKKFSVKTSSEKQPINSSTFINSINNPRTYSLSIPK